MKKILYTFALLGTLISCKTTQVQPEPKQPIIASLDLVNVDDDKVKVSVDPDRLTGEEIRFYIPKTVPGTYSNDDYGKLVEDFTALDYKGNEMEFHRENENTWVISNATELDKLTYFVNDTYDIEGEEGVFSPSGTNIAKNENFVLNLHGFVGYFENLSEEPYRLEITRPESIIPGTALSLAEINNGVETDYQTDIFLLNRYFEVIDNPIMYSLPDTTSFMVEDMEVLVNVYSPNKKYTSEDIKPGIEEMISAQKRFLGEIDNTGKYAILLYLSDTEKQDARGFGALEHHTSTVVVLPEMMQPEQLQETMTDVVSHEFFHILTPLNVHSEEIHYFDYNDPEMSQHLWMYEGVTEYFANLFQINQGLIDNEEFYNRMSEKIEVSQNFDDTMPFTEMSKNILDPEYKDSYYNVYQKGALIGMALDIRLRELSKGETGLLDLMKRLSEKYGKDKPFKDDELINVIVELSYPEIQKFFDDYITGSTPIPYNKFFEKVGLTEEEYETNTGYFLAGQTPYIDGNPDTGELFFRENISFNSFLDELGVEGGDILKSVNGQKYNIQTAYNLVMTAESWEDNEEVTFVVVRDGEELSLTAKTHQPTTTSTRIIEKDDDNAQVKLREAWLKG
ncbi:MAG: peptidase M61 [Salegentibacter sp.]|uniref:M61 family metallopeptidase n=1 Tax=Salegentibacter sp. TaxID=1903072 RepID=UPI0028700F8E|nr:peptidase M61 [Salegentibacter sp.]MDR9457424.1 peptidase M61 [Salegentibacter sp.]